jgi:hypothetical protein
LVEGRETQRKGDLAKAKAIAWFAEKHYEVGFLLTESAAYDLIVDDGLELHRVQVKYCGGRVIDLRRIHSNASGYIVKTYDKTAFDWLFVYHKSGQTFLITDNPASKKHITLNLGELPESGLLERS